MLTDYLHGKGVEMKGSLQTKSGKYYAVFRIDGKQKWINLYVEDKRGNKRKAETAMRELLKKYEQNPFLFEKIDFCEYIKKWLENTKTHVDLVTYNGYKQYAEKHIIPYFEPKKLSLQDVRMSHIEEYYNFKAIGGRLDGHERGLSLRTIKLHATVLSLVFKYAIREGIIRDNPVELARFPNIQKSKPKDNYYTVDECKKLLELSEGTPLHDIMVVTLYYGLRRSEAMGLRWIDVDFDRSTITIQHTRTLNGVVVEKDRTKTQSSNRVYPLIDEVRNILLKLKNEQERQKDLLLNKYTDSGYIFVNDFGVPYHPSYPTQMLYKLIKKHPELKHLTYHGLRHSAASLLLVRGWSMKEISEWLGHSNIHITMNLYTHIDMASKRERAEALNGLFAG